MPTPPSFSRRALVKGVAAASLLPLLGANLLACSDSGGSRSEPDVPLPPPGVAARFEHGVASGDPLSDRVILWTRATPEAEGFVEVAWELAEDAEFSRGLRSGRGRTDAAVDFTVKVDVDGLAPATQYYYRFRVGERVSPVGRTRTAPLGSVPAATFAVVSCSNYPAGYFHVYREVAVREVDAVLHLGDYLYEYAPGEYASASAEALGRVVNPPSELFSLADYRRRYAQYRGDGDLQAAHAAHPFIVVWDDHEIANDTWREGAENHGAGEGAFSARRAAAIQAWYEWLPVRPPTEVAEIIYRRQPWGDLLDLLMLDTRVVARDRQFTYAELASGGSIDVATTRSAIADARRSLLGDTQLSWLREQLSASAARWQVLGQQVLMGRYWLPAPIMEALDPTLADENALQAGTAAVLAAVEARNTPEAQRTPEQQALLDSAVPYNLDAWDGYAAERDALLRFAVDLGSRLVVLAGDTHNAWSSQLRTPEGTVAGVEFATPSVTSPGLEAVLGEDAAALFAPLMTTLVDDLVYADFSRRGFLTVRFTPEAVEAQWRYVSDIRESGYQLNAQAERSFTVRRDDLRLV
jgi:alkaline phosphatase D